ncbi:LPS export ABC transporter periplasmic protein LptC [Flavihumibacter profundi]|uniref:LPS export ABC transporter periplasmic protein LptC n=1 Tax=Flavihumibacter profundi TaxID=2716883 RepID=UPI001CC352BA|nr:LPS export ABC transporter periplasmic protein LptC [Flavihumibacter profundi]MBZ5858842.1 LPS export ABC transporter periplasmic protein LptC [Flavihumibacter profundi]
MINRFPYIKVSGLFLAAPIMCCLFLMSCENSNEELQALSTKRIAVEEARNIESYLSQGGKMKARLTAPVMNRYQTDTPYIEFPKTLHVDFYNDSLKVESQLNAKFGRYKETQQKVFLRDSVVVFNIKKDTLRSDELWWDQNTQKFYTDKPVQIHQPDKTIFGNGLEADQSFNWWIIKQVTGEVLVPKQGFGALAPRDSTKRTDSTLARDTVKAIK